ncbi:hypothetical protein QYE76_054532 [Lolium multiflorum]|uniref:SWIM-type domain-containing protein n=1 Tax=Lolium multiflorum TaxID=4521 RepID=A0AAD8SXW4_LOLMU|nr:hypothetical protein QYE76_054532 [Lolium multiflorum]
MHMVNRPATPYCSKIMEYMHKKKEKAKHLAVVQIGNVERRFEVRLPTDRFGCGNPQRTHDVKIGNEEWPTCECTCNKPKLLHLPCSHVLAVCGVLGMSEISFVSPYYLKEAVLNTWTEMAGRSLLNRDIERAHRAAKLEANPNSLSPMVTRGGNQNWQIHPGWVQRLKWAGLLPFARLVEATRSEVIGERVGTPIKRLQQDHSLLTSLVDRWRPETHTFHFRWGEMAPTLQDVSFLLGLPLAGQPIGPLAEPVLWDEEMPARFEGTRAGQTEFLCEDHGPKSDWLLNFEVSQFTPPMSEAQITRSLEAYILWLLGKVMFTENHQTTINRRFIPIALEIAEAQTADDIIQRSWGSAVLAATYRGLCNACTLVSPKSGLLGCPLFLQLWSWERFPIGRPDIDAERPFGANELADPDHIDMPTFGILWTRRERRFARDQVRNCYPAFTEQFDVLDDRAVIWQPYMAAAVHERYPGGISNLCYRDCAYWMTQSKIIFDVSVEIMAQQRIMRQFGSRQLVDPPPPIAPLPAYVHKYNRKGTSHSSTWWLQRVGSYVAEWDGATTHVWPNDEQFDPQEFAAYLQRYTAATRVRLIPPTDPAQAPPASMHDMYPTQSTAAVVPTSFSATSFHRDPPHSSSDGHISHRPQHPDHHLRSGRRFVVAAAHSFRRRLSVPAPRITATSHTDADTQTTTSRPGGGYSQHTASNPSWGASDRDPEHMEYYSAAELCRYADSSTAHTGDTDDPESGSWIPARITRAPDRGLPELLQPSCPWRTGGVWGGSADGSFNKLKWWLYLELPALSYLYPLCCHGGSGGGDVVLGAGFAGVAVASEMGLRRWTRSRLCCSNSSSSSATSVVVDFSGRRAAIWSAGIMRSLLFFLLAFEPYGRQFCCKSEFVASLTGCCWWRGDGEAFIPSGLSPAVKILVVGCVADVVDPVDSDSDIDELLNDDETEMMVLCSA